MSQYPQFIENTHFYSMNGGLCAEEQLAAMLSNTKMVFNLNHKRFEDFNELVIAYLRAGLDIFGLETGIVSHIADGVYSVVDVVSNQDGIKSGDKFPLDGTYCSEVIKCGKVLGFPNVGKLTFMQDHPVYVNLRLEAYLSAPIYVDDALYGTLNFTSTQPRDNGFSDHERDLITMMAGALGNFLLLRDREQRLKKFVGFVAHDLRGPLGSISSMAKMGLKPGLPQARLQQILSRITNISNVTLEFVHSVLNIAALGTGKLEANCKPSSLKSIIDIEVENLQDAQDLKKAIIHVDAEEGLVAMCDPSLLHQVFANLLMNAIKYSPESGTIDLSSRFEGGRINTVISNRKGGSEESVFNQERFKSIGFGLDIVKEILAAHGTSMEVGDTNTVYTVQFSLPVLS